MYSHSPIMQSAQLIGLCDLPNVRRCRHELINRLADEGRAVVVISSYLPEIMALSDRILVTRQGKVVEEFSALEATEERIVYAAIH